jgi:hypothetical protein
MLRSTSSSRRLRRTRRTATDRRTRNKSQPRHPATSRPSAPPSTARSDTGTPDYVHQASPRPEPRTSSPTTRDDLAKARTAHQPTHPPVRHSEPRSSRQQGSQATDSGPGSCSQDPTTETDFNQLPEGVWRAGTSAAGASSFAICQPSIFIPGNDKPSSASRRTAADLMPAVAPGSAASK